MLICGGYDDRLDEVVSKVKQIDRSNMNCVKDLAPINQCREYFEAVCLKGEVYVFGGINSYANPVYVIEKYSPSTNTWKILTEMLDKRQYFCVCAFMDKIIIAGGFFYNDRDEVYIKTNTCFKLNTKNNNFKEVPGMIEARDSAVCAVFQGNFVVSGG